MVLFSKKLTRGIEGMATFLQPSKGRKTDMPIFDRQTESPQGARMKMNASHSFSSTAGYYRRPADQRPVKSNVTAQMLGDPEPGRTRVFPRMDS
jgi:hypothetical protein